MNESNNDWELLSEKKLNDNLLNIISNQDKIQKEINQLSNKISKLDDILISYNTSSCTFCNINSNENILPNTLPNISHCQQIDKLNNQFTELKTYIHSQIQSSQIQSLQIQLPQNEYNTKIINKIDQLVNISNKIIEDNKIFCTKVETNNEFLLTIYNMLKENKTLYSTSLENDTKETKKNISIHSRVKDTNDNISSVLDTQFFTERLSNKPLPYELWKILSKK